jgi:hypothetical protein
MKQLICAGLLAFAGLGLHAAASAADAPPAAAQPAAGSCESKAVDKNGKPLAGAAKNSFMKKCEADSKQPSCEDKAVDKNGKPLAGAAKTSFLKKCEADAKAK